MNRDEAVAAVETQERTNYGKAIAALQLIRTHGCDCWRNGKGETIHKIGCAYYIANAALESIGL